MSFSGKLLLSAHGVEKRFGGVTALSDYSVEIKTCDLMGLIGPNGAGKTTVLKQVSFRELTVAAVCTGGVETNAGRAGDPASYYEYEGVWIGVSDLSVRFIMAQRCSDP